MLLILIICMLALCGESWETNKSSSFKKVDIYNIVKETFLTDKGYSKELSKHVSQEVFDKTNIYKAYDTNRAEFTKPLNINFSLKEVSQNKANDLIYVKMIYSIEIKDSQNKIVGGSKDIPITFTVENKDSNLYIMKKEEPA